MHQNTNLPPFLQYIIYYFQTKPTQPAQHKFEPVASSTPVANSHPQEQCTSHSMTFINSLFVLLFLYPEMKQTAYTVKLWRFSY